MDSLSLKEITSQLENDVNMIANIELARRVSLNIPDAVGFYISDLSRSIVEYITYSILHRDAFSEYYIFLSSPYTQNNHPEWKKVASYKGRNNCTLKTYTSNITCRHFCKIAQKEKKESQTHGMLLEFMDYESLIKCDTGEEEFENTTSIAMRQAFLKLNDRDRLILKYLVIEKISALDAFELLDDYINPRPKFNMTSSEVKASLSVKQKQDAISLLKGRALLKLQELYTEQLKQMQYD